MITKTLIGITMPQESFILSGTIPVLGNFGVTTLASEIAPSGTAKTGVGVRSRVGSEIKTGTGVTSGVGVTIGTAHIDLVIVFVSKVTAPFLAKIRPFTLAPVFKVADIKAKIVPLKVEFVPSVAELPTCQKTLQA